MIKLLQTKLTNKFWGLLFLGSGLLVTSLLSSCTVNVKHSEAETKKETKVAPKTPKEAPRVKVVKWKEIVDPRRFSSNVWVRIDATLESIDNKLDQIKITNKLLSKILEKIEMKAAKGLL